MIRTTENERFQQNGTCCAILTLIFVISSQKSVRKT